MVEKTNTVNNSNFRLFQLDHHHDQLQQQQQLQPVQAQQQPKQFMKVAASTQDPLLKREQFAVSLRKQKKETMIKDRRKKLLLKVNGSHCTTQTGSRLQQRYRECNQVFKSMNICKDTIVSQKVPQLAQISTSDQQQRVVEQCKVLVDCLYNGQANATLSDIEQLALLVAIRERFSAPELPIETVMQTTNIICHIQLACQVILNKFQTSFHSDLIKFMALELCWILANLSSGPSELIESLFFTCSEVTYGQNSQPLPALNFVLVALSDTNNLQMCEIALWLTANCFGDETQPKLAHFFVYNGQFFNTLFRISEHLDPQKPSELEDIMLWNLEQLQKNFNLVQSTEYPKIKSLLHMSLLQSQDQEIQIKATNLLCLLVARNCSEQDLIQLLGQNILPFLLRQLSKLTNKGSPPLYILTLKVISNICSCESDLYMRQAIEGEILDRLHAVILQEKIAEMKEACWTLSNIACHDDLMANHLVQDEVFLTVAGLLNSNNIKVRHQAVFCISNVLMTLPLDKMRKLLTEEQQYKSLLHDFCKCMQLTSEKEIVYSILDAIEYMCEADEQMGLEGEHSFQYLIEVNQGLDHLEDLRNSGIAQIVDKVEYLCITYLEKENENDQYQL